MGFGNFKMQKANLDPKTIHSFMPAGLDSLLRDYVKQNGWDNVPPIPVFEIPQELREDGFKYVLADGNHRKEVALSLVQKVPSIIYEPHEQPSPERDGLASFKHHNDQTLYKKLVLFYIKRKELTPECVLGRPLEQRT